MTSEEGRLVDRPPSESRVDVVRDVGPEPSGASRTVFSPGLQRLLGPGWRRIASGEGA